MREEIQAHARKLGTDVRVRSSVETLNFFRQKSSYAESPELDRGGTLYELVGREAELKEGGEALSDLQRGQPGFLVIAGEPGIGKSTLLSALVERAERSGAVVLVGSGGELEQDLPFGVVADALDPYVASLGATVLGLDPETISHLGAVLPSSATSSSVITLQQERHRAYRAIRAVLEHIAQRKRLVLAFDDMHWADPASVELVSYLLRHPPDAPVLLLMTLRPHQTSPRLRLALEAARHEGKARWMELTPLSRQEAEALTRRELHRPLQEAIFIQSGGNPFYLLALARAAEQRGESADQEVGMGGDETPEVVLVALNQELSLLSTPARRVLQGGAVAGDPFELDLAAAAAGVGEDEVFQPLDELLEAGLIHPGDTPRRFRFRHPIVRQAVYDSAGRGWRLRAHQRLAAFLDDRGAPPAARAHHIERSAKAGDSKAIALLTEAAESIVPHAPANATRWFEAALRLLPEDPGTREQRLRLLASRAVALASTGRLEESHETLLNVLHQLPPRAEGRINFVAQCAGVETALGLHDQARERLLAELHGLSDHDSLEALMLRVELCQAALYRGDPEGVERLRKWAAEARDTSSLLNHLPLRTIALTFIAYADYWAGRMADGRAHLTEAAELFDGLADDELAKRLDAVHSLCWIETIMERFDDAARHARRGIAVARATGQGQFLLSTMLAEGWAKARAGRLADAASELEEAVEAARLAGLDQFLSLALSEYCAVLCLRGDLSAAIRFGEEAVQVLRNLEPTVVTAWAGSFLGEALLEAGQAATARTELLRAYRGPDLPIFPKYWRCQAYETLIRVELALCRLDEADAWMARLKNEIPKGLLPLDLATAARAEATILLARGETSAAAELALHAARLEAETGAPVEAGRSGIVAGRALIQAGERQRATDELRHAVKELVSCGASRLTAEAAAELRRLGHRAPRSSSEERPRPAVRGLSVREGQVAELVRQGKSNRAIAADLFLSQRTVENHLAHIFTKLGVSSRTSLIAAMGAKDVDER